MTLTLSLISAVSLATLQPQAEELLPVKCDDGQPAAHAPDELSQFGFLIGDYTITLHQMQGDQWSPPRPGTPARWNGWYGLEGMAIVDEWFHVDPGPAPEAPRGINVRMYDPDAEEWDMMWISTTGKQVQDLRAKVIDGVLTMWQVYPERADFKAEFYVIDEHHWDRITYAKDEDGNWIETFKLSAARMPCLAD